MKSKKQESELSKEIAEGVFNGGLKLIGTLLIIVVLIELIYVGLNLYGDYSYDKCIEEGRCIQAEYQMNDPCTLERLQCYVWDKSKAGDNIPDAPIEEKYSCGWVEAEAWFEIFKRNNQGEFSMECY